MRNLTEPQLAKWPFFLGDVLLIGAAWFIVSQTKLPISMGQMLFVVLCVGGGAWLAIMPFLFAYRLALKRAEARQLANTDARMRNFRALAAELPNTASHDQKD